VIGHIKGRSAIAVAGQFGGRKRRLSSHNSLLKIRNIFGKVLDKYNIPDLKHHREKTRQLQNKANERCFQEPV